MDMQRVVINKAFVTLVSMQVCAVEDATDEEILELCNRENYAGTTNGWTTVHRDGEAAPVVCGGYPERRHIIVTC